MSFWPFIVSPYTLLFISLCSYTSLQPIECLAMFSLYLSSSRLFLTKVYLAEYPVPYHYYGLPSTVLLLEHFISCSCVYNMLTYHFQVSPSWFYSLLYQLYTIKWVNYTCIIWYYTRIFWACGAGIIPILLTLHIRWETCCMGLYHTKQNWIQTQHYLEAVLSHDVMPWDILSHDIISSVMSWSFMTSLVSWCHIMFQFVEVVLQLLFLSPISFLLYPTAFYILLPFIFNFLFWLFVPLCF